jgi:hypothetical protein
MRCSAGLKLACILIEIRPGLIQMHYIRFSVTNLGSSSGSSRSEGQAESPAES